MAVVVYVVKAGGEAEVLGLRRERGALRVEEASAGEWFAREPAGAIVDVQTVGIGALYERHCVELRPIQHPVVGGELWRDVEAVGDPFHYLVERSFAGGISIMGRAGLVGGNVEVQITVAIDVGERCGRGA